MKEAIHSGNQLQRAGNRRFPGSLAIGWVDDDSHWCHGRTPDRRRACLGDGGTGEFCRAVERSSAVRARLIMSICRIAFTQSLNLELQMRELEPDANVRNEAAPE